MYSLKREEDIFRLAAVLYKDGNYEVKKENTIKKIIKAIFLEYENVSKTISEIIKAIDENYFLPFSEEEIKKILNESSETFQMEDMHLEVPKYNLIENVYIKLKDKIKKNDLKYYVDKYLKSINSKNMEEDRAKIFQFLYSIFTKNLENYNLFLHSNVHSFSDILKEYSISDIDINLINNFFKYNAVEKDKIIFDIISLSLEYCLLASPKELSQKQISNKIFFLDSNVLYRAIGLNGEERKELTLQFIKRCIDYEINLKILSVTEEEFKGSIKHRINRLFKIHNHNSPEEIFKKYSSDGIYLYYYNWKKNRTNINMREFESFIFSKYEELKENNKITVEYKNNVKFEENNEMQKMKDSIFNFKRISDFSSGEYIAKNDTQIILSLLKIRKEKNDINKGILNMNNFLISTDQQLRDWSLEYGFINPIILLPSEWMTIMFRFLGRTSNDYKSFVSFLNLKNKEQNIYSPEIIDIILSGISEITQDLKEQKYYAEQIIEHDIFEIIHPKNPCTINSDELFTKVTNYVKDSMDSKITDKNIEIDKLNKENNKIREELKLKNVRDDIKKWSNLGYFTFPIVIILFLYMIQHFFLLEKSWNIYSFIWNYVSILNDGAKNIFYYLDILITGGLLYKVYLFSYNRLCKSSKVYQNKLRETYKKYEI